MEFTIDRGEFIHGLSLAQGVVERRNTLPILANVLIEANGGVSIAATDLEVHVKRRCGAAVRKSGAATVGARKLYEFVRELRAGNDVVVRLLDNQFVEVVSGRSRLKLVGLPATDFPAFAQGKEASVASFRIAAARLARLIDSTLFAVSADDTRPHLAGVFATASGGTLRCVGTDGHRLAMIEEPLKEPGISFKGLILPRKGLSEIRKLLDEEGEDAKLTIAANAIKLERGQVEYLVRLIDGEFPNYEQVLPKSTKHKIVVDKGELFSALRRVSVVASDRARGVKLHLAAGQLVVSASSPEFGEASEEIEVAYRNEEFSVGFNARYLTDVLAVLPDDQRVEIGLSDDVSPGVLRTEDDESYSYIVMPMRL